MRPIFALLCFFFTSFYGGGQVGFWTKKADFPGLDRDDALALSGENDALFFSGNHGGLTESNRCYRYNFATDTWSETTLFPGAARQYAGGFVLGNQAYVIGGIDGGNTPLKDIWRFDFVENSWAQLPDFPGQARWSFVAFSLLDKGYVATGATPNQRLNDFWQFDPITQTWQEKAIYPGGARRDACSMVIQHRAYVGLGFDTYDEGGFRSDFWSYDPITDTWESIAPYPEGKISYAQAEGGVSLGLVGTGTNYTNDLNAKFYRFSPQLKRWDVEQDLPFGATRGCSSFSNGASIYFLTGLNPDNSRTTELWQWSTEAQEKGLKIFPNPSNSASFCQGESNAPFQIVSINGIVCFSGKLDDKGFARLPSLISGIYFIVSNGFKATFVVN